MQNTIEVSPQLKTLTTKEVYAAMHLKHSFIQERMRDSKTLEFTDLSVLTLYQFIELDRPGMYWEDPKENKSYYSAQMMFSGWSAYIGLGDKRQTGILCIDKFGMSPYIWRDKKSELELLYIESIQEAQKVLTDAGYVFQKWDWSQIKERVLHVLTTEQQFHGILLEPLDVERLTDAVKSELVTYMDTPDFQINTAAIDELAGVIINMHHGE